MSRMIILIIFTTLFVLCTIPASCQQPEGLFYDLIGRSRSFIERYYPHYIEFKAPGDVYNGYYAITKKECKDGGYALLLLGFNGKKDDSIVRDIAFRLKGCSEYIEDNNIYQAGDLFVFWLGIDDLIPEVNTYKGLPNMYFISYKEGIGGTVSKVIAEDNGEIFINGSFCQTTR